jgi:hypothetical protein
MEEKYGNEMFVTENDYNTMVGIGEDVRVRRIGVIIMRGKV